MKALLNWLGFQLSREQRLIRKAMSISSSDVVSIVLDSKTEMMVFAYGKKVVPVRGYHKGTDNVVKVVSHMLNNNKRGQVMVDFLRYLDAALYNLTMSDKKLQKKIEKINKEAKAEGVEFGIKDQMADRLKQ